MNKLLSSDKKQTRDTARESRVVIVTGLSGSGKTVALRALEDLQFFCVDNLPVSLINSLLTKISGNTKTRNVAIGIDIRERQFLNDLDKTLFSLKSKHNIEILFLETETDVLVRRFKETRRPHPLDGDLEGAIRLERESLEIFKQNADKIIDTTSYSPHQLRHLVSTLYRLRNGKKDLSVSLMSFGFKYGVPQNIDLLFDVRFLPNPHFVAELRPLNGTDKPVADYVFSQPETKEFMEKLMDMIEFLMPLYLREGKSYLSIGIGCTGGRHRSPAIAEEVFRLMKKENIDLDVIHRDLA